MQRVKGLAPIACKTDRVDTSGRPIASVAGASDLAA
jgi:hypothetical protein